MQIPYTRNNYVRSINKAFKELLNQERFASQSEIVEALKIKDFKRLISLSFTYVKQIWCSSGKKFQNGNGYCLPSELSVPATSSPLKIWFWILITMILSLSSKPLRCCSVDRPFTRLHR